MTSRPTPLPREYFKEFIPIQTRWMDNDVYGHVNNVIYYSYFDTAINQWMIKGGYLDIDKGPSIAVVVETSCTYFQSVLFPDELEVGISVSKLGRSSVHYDTGIFRLNADIVCAQGRFVHVFIDRTSRQPVEIPSRLRAALEARMAAAVEGRPGR